MHLSISTILIEENGLTQLVTISNGLEIINCSISECICYSARRNSRLVFYEGLRRWKLWLRKEKTHWRWAVVTASLWTTREVNCERLRSCVVSAWMHALEKRNKTAKPTEVNSGWQRWLAAQLLLKVLMCSGDLTETVAISDDENRLFWAKNGRMGATVDFKRLTIQCRLAYLPCQSIENAILLELRDFCCPYNIFLLYSCLFNPF